MLDFIVVSQKGYGQTPQGIRLPSTGGPFWSPGKEQIISIIIFKKGEQAVKIDLAGDEVGNLSYGPEDFSESEKKTAEQHGACLKFVYSKTAEESYLANVCKECGAFVGKWFYFAHYYTPALYGHYKYQIV